MLNALATLSLATTLTTSPGNFSSSNDYIETSASGGSPFALIAASQTDKENNSIFLTKTVTDVLLDVPFVHQKDDLKNTPDEWAGGSACGPSAITMALKFNGEEISLYDVVNTLPTSVYVKGKMFYNLSKGPEYFGYQSTEIEINTEQIFNTLSDGNPVLLNVQNYDGITGHEIVVVGIKGYNSETKTAYSLIVHDPFKAPYREFKYINEHTLQQPEGWILPIGIIKPFYITNASMAINILADDPAVNYLLNLQ